MSTVPVVCSDCGVKYECPKSTYDAIKREGRAFRCHSCAAKYRKEFMTRNNKNRTPEQKMACYAKVSAKQKKNLAEMDSETKAARMAKLNKGRDAWKENVTQEEKERISQAHSEANKTRWANMSKEEHDAACQKLRESWQNKSDEEKQAHAERSSKTWKQYTPEEYKETCEKMSDAKKEYWSNLTPEEYEQLCSSISKTVRERIDLMTDEERAEHIRKIKAGMESMDDETKQLARQRLIQALTDYWASAPDEVKKERARQLHEGREEWEANLTEEEIEARRERSRNAVLTWWQSLTEEELAEISRQRANKWNQMTPEQQNAKLAALHQGGKEWNQNLSDEERAARRKRLADAYLEWWNNLSDADYARISNERRKNSTDFWNNLSPEEQARRISKIAANTSNSGNRFNQRFEKRFNESHLVNDFYYKPEFISTNGGFCHHWDYAIFNKSDDTLALLLDLDGEYYHADNGDYDDIKSHERLDVERAHSVPDGVKHFIIHEGPYQESRDFKELVKIIYKNYDEYVDYIFTELRHISIPIPRYTPIELLKSYIRLQYMQCDKYPDISADVRIGDRLIQHYHRNIWNCHTKGCISPFDAWYDDEILKKCIENRIVYQNHLNPNKILHGFSASKIAPKVSVFSAARAKLIINKYLSDFYTIFDPFSGFSGRMLGAIASGKIYIGQDINEITVTESNQILDFLMTEDIKFDASVTCQDILTASGSYPCLFTCPPYSDKEQWNGTPVDKRSCDDWIDICLERFKCKRYVFVVDNTTKYAQYVVDDIINKSHFGIKSEKLIVIDK